MCKLVTTEEYKKAINYARRKMANAHDAEQDARDVVQEALIKLWRKKDPTNKYLYRYIQDSISAMYVTRSAIKRKDLPSNETISEVKTLEEQVQIKEQLNLIIDFIQSPEGLALPEEQRTVLDLVAGVQDHVQTALVVMYGMSKPLANYHYHQAFKHLAKYINGGGATPCNTSV